MDRERPGHAERKRIKSVVYLILVGVGLAAITWAFSRLEPALPLVKRASVWLGQVERGPLVVEVSGTGTLVPEEIRWIAAVTDGRVESIPILPGCAVNAGTVLVELNDPALEQQSLDAALQLKKALAELENLEIEIERQDLTQQAQAATVQADYMQKRLEAERYEALAREGLVSELSLKVLRITAEELQKRHELEQERVEIGPRSRQARLAAKEAEIEQSRGLFELRREQVDKLQVRAGIDGVLQEVTVEVGQQIRAGDILGKVAVPGRLKAELRIPETQTRDVRSGLSASIDTRNGLVSGTVVRIDPAAREGTVLVDVAFTEKLPAGTRPDQSITGTIQIDRLDNVLKMGRPVFGQANRTIGMFKLVEEGREAVRVPVLLGRSSVSVIQVVQGLEEGDQVILSDTSAWDEFDRIKLD